MCKNHGTCLAVPAICLHTSYFTIMYEVITFFNLLKLISYFPGILHGNVAAQLFTLLSGLIVQQMFPNSRDPDTIILWISNYCSSVTTSFWRALSRTMSKIQSDLCKTVVKLELLNNATELVWARPGDVLLCELSVTRWISLTLQAG